MNTSQNLNLFETFEGQTLSEKICTTFIEWYRDTPPSYRRFVLETLGPVGVLRQIREKLSLEIKKKAITTIEINISPSPLARERRLIVEEGPLAPPPTPLSSTELRKRKQREETERGVQAPLFEQD
jgi:hypothetical protein